jgi:hypothetical protein
MDDQHDPEPTLKILTTVPSNAEAAMVVGELEGAGIQAMQRPGALPGGLWGGPGSCDIYVEQQDLDRAREVLSTEAISEDELVQAEEEAATQLTQPKGIDPKTGKPYEPVEIPVPKRVDWERALKRASQGSTGSDDRD